jgi:H+/Cl- antiporter ClcA
MSLCVHHITCAGIWDAGPPSELAQHAAANAQLLQHPLLELARALATVLATWSKLPGGPENAGKVNISV